MIGLALTLAAGVLSGNCMLPLKFVRRWKWENVWLVFSLVSLVALPWALALATIGNVVGVYTALPPAAFFTPLVFGAGWGIAQVLFGLSITRLGLALGYALIVGLGAVLGTLVPLLVNNRPVIATWRGAAILSGVAIMALGITTSARAGNAREGSKRAESGGSYSAALAVAILCGIMAPMLNYAFAFGQTIAQEAVRQGASPESAGYAVWPVALTGGLIPNLMYACWLLTRNSSWRLFRGSSSPDAWLGGMMGILWMSAFAIYGVGSVYLGSLGTSVGWALFQISMIMTANLSGVLAGEWSTAAPRVRRQFWAGVALLGVATVIIAAANP